MNEPLRKMIRVSCARAHAFEIFTAHLDSWWPVGHRKLDQSRLVLEPRVGGRFFERGARGEEFKLGDVLLWDSPQRVCFTWFLGAIKKPTHVEVTFEEAGQETLVYVLHSEAQSELGTEWPGRAVLFERGWTRVLEAFRVRTLKGENG